MKDTSIALAIRALDGVGVLSSDIFIPGSMTLTLRRMCRESERVKVIEPYWMGEA